MRENQQAAAASKKKREKTRNAPTPPPTYLSMYPLARGQDDSMCCRLFHHGNWPSKHTLQQLLCCSEGARASMRIRSAAQHVVGPDWVVSSRWPGCGWLVGTVRGAAHFFGGIIFAHVRVRRTTVVREDDDPDYTSGSHKTR